MVRAECRAARKLMLVEMETVSVAVVVVGVGVGVVSYYSRKF